ncbi:MAG: isoaspartyl peptidase/L-asparaginase [Candidatus Thermoplasmatota archaeon]|nr:isoaspartyl peptidase/L-asparaginase [Candidatus Thermoplasmatota archaeon]
MRYTVLAHGGAGSFDTKEHDGPEQAARRGLQALQHGGSPLDAAIAATKHLEDDERFNAGTGSNLRFDGETIEMDASVMTSDGRFGAVAGLRRVRYPVAVAADLLETPHDLLVGEGALRYARARGHEDHDPRTRKAEQKHAKVVEMVRTGEIEPGWSDWELGTLKEHWNYDKPMREVFGPSDTVGAVASDGTRFAAALSTGGTAATLLGRVGDVPLPGCGLHAGPEGAVCVTGDGEHLARARLADTIYAWLEEGIDLDDVVPSALELFPDQVAVGLLVVTADGFTGGSNLPMAWSAEEVDAHDA